MKYHWKGRTADGHVIEGKLVAHSKEDLMTRMRAQRIAITEVLESGDGGEPPDPDQHVAPPPEPIEMLPSLPGERPVPKPTRVRGILAILVLIAIAVVVGAMSPIVFVKCDRAAGAVACTINDRILGVVPMRAQTLAGVISVDTETERWRDRRGTSSSSVARSKSRIVLHDTRGTTIRPFAWDQNGTLGTSTSDMEQDIDRFLSDPTQTTIARWQGQSVPMLMPAILLGLAVLMIGLLLLSLNERATRGFYNWISAAAERAEQRRKHHKR